MKVCSKIMFDSCISRRALVFHNMSRIGVDISIFHWLFSKMLVKKVVTSTDRKCNCAYVVKKSDE
jgi:hypothetical protein